MHWRSSTLTIGLLACALGCLPARSARAALGGDAAGIDQDAARLQGALSFRDQPPCRLAEIDAGNGVLVREYINDNGVVFAVAWTGPVMPDLQVLLGSRYAAYAAALAALPSPGLHRSLSVTAADAIVDAGGHLRAYSGRAYLPALLPAGVTAAELR
jgi:hypothetical protein